MNDLVSQLLQLGPGIAAGATGNGHGMNAFMESFNRTKAILDQQDRQKQMDQSVMQDRAHQQQRETEQDTRATEDRARQQAMQTAQLPNVLAQGAASAETLPDAEQSIDALYRILAPQMGGAESLGGVRDVAMRQAGQTITARQKRQVSEFVEAALKTSFVADNPDADPEVQNLPPHIVKVLGKPSARLSELQQFAELPVGKPAGKTRVPAAPGSQEEFSDPTTTPERKAQILKDRQAYMQSDDRAPRVTVNTGANDARVNSRIDRITNSFNTSPIVKEFNEVQAQHQTIAQVVNSPWSGPGDMSVIFAFMKALDPNSVVRETEYSNASKSGNIFSGWAAKFNGALSPNGGFLSDAVKQDFLRTIETRMGVKRAQYDNLRTQTVKKIDRIKAGAPETGDEAVTDYGAAFPGAAPKPKFELGQKVRNKTTGEIGYVTGVRPDGAPIIGSQPPVKQ
jgi:hypothetical protein